MMVVRSMAQVCDHSIPGIAGSNSLEGMGTWRLCDEPITRPEETYRLFVPTKV